MKTFSLALALLFAAPLAFGQGQGQVLFANKGTDFDAPVFAAPGYTIGPGPNFSAQLLLVGDGGALTALMPTSTFQPAGFGAAAIADRYWWPQTVDIPRVNPG